MIVLIYFLDLSSAYFYEEPLAVYMFDGLYGEQLTKQRVYIFMCVPTNAVKSQIKSNSYGQFYTSINLNQSIKLMKMEREVANLEEEDFKKLFPNQYYSKYAPHLKVLQFEKAIFDENRPITKPNQFVKRATSMPTIKTNIVSKVKLSKYDPVEDIISKNKAETARMQAFNKQLNNKLKVGPPKNTSSIRSPLRGFNGISDQVLDRMRFIQNEKYLSDHRLKEKKSQEVKFCSAEEMKKVRTFLKQQRQENNHKSHTFSSKYKSKLRQESVVSIQKVRNKSFNLRQIKSDMSIAAQSANSKQIHDQDYIQSNTLQRYQMNHQNGQKSIQRFDENYSLNYQERLERLMQQARSQIVQINPQDKTSVAYIMVLNKSIKKMNLLEDQMHKERSLRAAKKMMMSVGQNKLETQNSHQRQIKVQSNVNKEPKNMFDIAASMRKDGSQIQILSMFKDLIKQRQMKAFLQQIQ